MKLYEHALLASHHMHPLPPRGAAYSVSELEASIPPELVAILLGVMQDLLAGCLSKDDALDRIAGYALRPRVMDDVMLGIVIRKHMNRPTFAQVQRVKAALVARATNLTKSELAELQAEALSMAD